MNDHPDTDLTDPHGEAEALRKENERLRAEIAEATDPDFIWGAMYNVHDADTKFDYYADAVSRAQRAAITALRAQPDWKAMAERLGEALAEANDTFSGIADHILQHKNAPTKIVWPGVFADCQRGGLSARAALSDLAKMKVE